MILEIALKNYINFLKKRGSSEKTQKKYYNQIKKLFIFSNKTGEDRKNITQKEIDKYIKSQKRAHNTKCSEIAQIKSFIKFHNIQKIISLDSRSIYLPKREAKEARFLENKEINKIIKKIKNENIKLRTGIMIMLTTGARISEACNITKKQLEKALKIDQNFQISIIGKGKRKRSIFLPKKIYDLCLKNSNLHNGKTIIGRNSQQFSRNLRKFRETMNLKKFTAHSFRHAYITALAQNGVELYKIQKLAGHSNINTTAIYLHSCNHELSQATNSLTFADNF